jgi:hypothetical protein
MPDLKHIKALADHLVALEAVKKKYQDETENANMKALLDLDFNAAYSQINTITDKLFVLDYMLESNKRVLHYLQQFQKHNTSRGTQAFNRTLEAINEKVIIDDNDGIHVIAMKIEEAAREAVPAIAQPVKDNYQMWSYIYGGLVGLCFTLACGLGPIGSLLPIEALMYAAGVGGFFNPAIMVTALATVLIGMYCGYHYSLYDQVSDISDRQSHKSGEVKAEPKEKRRFRVLTELPKKAEEVTAVPYLRHKYAHKKVTKEGNGTLESNHPFFFQNDKTGQELRQQYVDEGFQQEVEAQYKL